MQTIGEERPALGAERILCALSRLTVLRPLLEEAPFSQLYRLGRFLQDGALYQAMEAYHGLCAALIAENCRAVSGDLFLDYLLYALLERENDFSRRAAEQRWNDAVSAAMASDLEQLQTLSGVTSALLKEWIGRRGEELRGKALSTAQKQDDIAALSAAVWSGSGAPPKKKVNQMGQAAPVPQTAQAPRTAQAVVPPLPALGEKSWPTFRYALEGLEGEYVSDIALEEMYHRILAAKDWSRLLDDIWSFHGAYGTGGFVKYRAFCLEQDGGLRGMEPAPRFDQGPRLYEAARNRILAGVIRFMQGEGEGDILVSGGPGTGKTAGAIDLYYELPELRLVMASDPEPEALGLAASQIARQPARVLLLLDDVECVGPRLARQMAAVAQRRGSNLLVMAAVRAGADPAFPNVIRFPDLQPREFMQTLREMLVELGVHPTEDMLQNACIDCGAQKRTLCYATAAAVARDMAERE